MKTTFSVFAFIILMISSPAFAGDCDDTTLILRQTKIEPQPGLKRHFYSQSKLWFTQETHLQKPAQVNYDTVIVASNSKGSLIEILVEGHFREFAVNAKWMKTGRLAIDVEWGRNLFCSYSVDLDQVVVTAAKKGKSPN